MSACAAYGCKNRPHNKIPGITFHKFPNDVALRNEWVLAVRRVNFRPTKYSRLCSEHFSEDQIDRTSLACVRLRENAVPNIFTGYPKHLQKEVKQLSSTKSESMIGLKRKYINEAEDEDLSDEGLDEIDTNSEDVEQIDDSEIIPNEKNYASQSSNDTNKIKFSCHPNILRLMPANAAKDVQLNPDLIDSLTCSSQVDSSSGTPNSNNAAPQTLTLSKLSNEMILKKKVHELEIVNSSFRKKLKLLQQQNRRQKARIDALQSQIRDLEKNRSTDEDISEDYLSEDEIYEEMLKHQRETSENNENSG